MIMSLMSTISMEQVVREVGNQTDVWAQLYLFKDKDLTLKYIRRAESCGVKALIAIADVPYLMKNLEDWRFHFALPSDIQLPNFEELFDEPNRTENLFEQLNDALEPTFTWEDFDWLKTITHLPILIQGVASAGDAEMAIKRGANGIIVSNHSGIQFQFAPSCLETLTVVAETVNKRVPVILDGGVRRGADILKSLALGADMVLIGRPIIFALAVAGKEGIDQILQIFKEELTRSMALSGATDVRAVNSNIVISVDELQSQL